MKITAIVIAVLVAAFLIFAALRPDTFVVQRSAVINASPEKIAPLISDFHNWSSWSPYEKLDPAMKKSFSGAPSGQGAIYDWEGNSKVGKGRMEITMASASLVSIKMDFVKPMEGHDVIEFALEPKGQSTNVTWTMRGPNNYFAKVMGIFFNIDKIVGKDFESGLAQLKSVAEK